MAHLDYTPVLTPQRKKIEKPAKTVRKTVATSSKGLVWGSFRKATAAIDAQAVRAMHSTIIDRARTCFDVTNMTHFDASMSEVEMIAKFMGISVEEAAKL